MSNDEIRQLVQLVIESGIAEIEVQRGEDRVRIRRMVGSRQEITLSPTGQQMTPPAAPAVPPSAPPASEPAPVAAAENESAPAANETVIKSPIVGTYYDAPKPGDPPFVKAGDAVEAGQVLCIIESMKLMNEIEAEISGTVVRKLLENGRPVEYGEALFIIRPR